MNLITANQDDLFFNLKFDEKFISVDQMRNDTTLLSEWNTNKNTFQNIGAKWSCC